MRPVIAASSLRIIPPVTPPKLRRRQRQLHRQALSMTVGVDPDALHLRHNA
jgi:hypothetical protein